MKLKDILNEDTDIGHQDDEPKMLKSTALEIAEYGQKLVEKLSAYDNVEGEVDFPNWWQSKLTLAKDYVQKAYHYLDSEEKTSNLNDVSESTGLKNIVDEMKMVNKKTGKDITKFVLQLLQGKITQKEFEKITGLKKDKMSVSENVWKRFDAMQKLQGAIMDIEDDMRDINQELSQLHKDMEQEAEPSGGPIASKYGKQIEKKQKEYKKKRAEFKKLMAKLDKLEQY